MAARVFLRIFALIGVVLSVAAGVRSQFTMNVELSRSLAHIGNDFTASCRVVNEQKKPVFIVWVRKTDDDTTEIASSEHINYDFKHTGRYSANVTGADDLGEVTFYLRISALEGADSGEIGCRIPSQNIEVFKELTVFVPIKTVKLTSQYTNGTHAMAYVDGQIVSFTEGESRRFFCHVNGSYPAPKIAVMIGDKVVTGDFSQEVRLVKKGSVKGLQLLTYEVTLSNDELALDYVYNNNMLKCVATLPGSGFPANSLGFDIQIAKYKPKFDCEDTVVSRIHENDLNITCIVHADPPVSKTNFYWSRFSSGDAIMLAEGEEDGHYAAYIMPGSTMDEIRMVLRIDRVFTQHFRKYFFHAENSLGNSTFAVSLMQEDSHKLTSGTSAIWVASYTLLALVAAARLL